MKSRSWWSRRSSWVHHPSPSHHRPHTQHNPGPGKPRASAASTRGGDRTLGRRRPARGSTPQPPPGAGVRAPGHGSSRCVPRRASGQLRLPWFAPCPYSVPSASTNVATLRNVRETRGVVTREGSRARSSGDADDRRGGIEVEHLVLVEPDAVASIAIQQDHHVVEGHPGRRFDPLADHVDGERHRDHDSVAALVVDREAIVRNVPRDGVGLGHRDLQATQRMQRCLPNRLTHPFGEVTPSGP